MPVDAGEALARLLRAAFVECDLGGVVGLVEPRARIRDPHVTDPTREGLVELVALYRHALSERDLRITAEVADTQQALAHYCLSGQHIGAAWGVVPVGRHVELEGSTAIRVNGDEQVTEVVNAWATGSWLRGFGLHDAGAQTFDIYAITTRGQLATELLAGEPERTLWAHAWALSPFLARTAVLVMAGLDASAMSCCLGVTQATVRTYVRQLYRATGVHGRIPLLRRALELARAPHTPTHDWEGAGDALC